MANAGKEGGANPPFTMSVQRWCSPEKCTGCRGCGGFSQNGFGEGSTMVPLSARSEEEIRALLPVIGEGAVQALLAQMSEELVS